MDVDRGGALARSFILWLSMSANCVKRGSSADNGTALSAASIYSYEVKIACICLSHGVSYGQG